MSRYSLRSRAKKQAQPGSLVALNTNLHWDLREISRPSTPTGGCNRKAEERTRIDLGCKRAPRKKAKILAKENMSEHRPVAAAESSSNKRARKLPAGETLKEKAGGEVDLLEELPVEVLLQIFVHLQFLDILHLSRTSKYLRNMLMSRSSKFIWHIARSNVEDLPPLPPDLNEVQYANLMFDPYCHNCMREGCEEFLWSYRMRCCTECQYDILFAIHEIEGQGISSSSLSEIRLLVPRHILRLPKEKMRLCSVFLPSIVKRYVSEYKATEGDYEQRTRWLDERERDHETLRNHTMLCRQWERRQILSCIIKLHHAFKNATDWDDAQIRNYHDTLLNLSGRL